MILQLAVFSLWMLFLLLAGQLLALVLPAGGDPVERLEAVIGATMPTYAVTAAYALLAYLQGKPDLMPQYLVWIVVILSLIRAGTLYPRQEALSRLIGIANVLILAFLWVLELPVFQPHPA